MGYCAKILLVILIAISGVVYQQYRNISRPLDLPPLELNAYWGAGDKLTYKENTKISPLKNLVPAKAIENLKKQLSVDITLHEPLENVNCEYGVNTIELRRIIKYWRENYLNNWKQREAHLMSLSHFTTEIQGLKIHFIHQKAKNSENKKVYPVLLIHGWPGSVLEFYEMVKLLADSTKGKDYVFDIVVPSLPGYGWSEASSKTGMGPVEMAVIFHKLMTRLGYAKYFVQGGDWGSLIGSNVATIFPENVYGYHSNMCSSLFAGLPVLKKIIASFAPSSFIDEKYVDFYFPAVDQLVYMLQESGYMHIQSTKPDTIGAALTENPIGLAAYILEKFSTWTDPKFVGLKDCGLTKKFSMEQLLDNVMVYYLTNSITTSVRLYKEAFSPRQMEYNIDRVPVQVPVACARFKNDLSFSFDWQLSVKYPKLVQSTHYRDGGHFIAYENPQVLTQDFVQFVENVVQVN